MKKTNPHYHLSDDYEEVEVRIVGKKIKNKYYFGLPNGWDFRKDDGLIIINLLNTKEE